MNLFLAIPIWVIFILTFLIAFFAFKGGVFLGSQYKQNIEQDRLSIHSIVAAALGLLALLLAFTFGFATSKFDERKNLIVNEANAIRTTYLRANYLAEPYRKNLKSLLEKYVAIRLYSIKPGKLIEGLRKSEELQDELWKQAVAVEEKNPNSVAVGLFIQSLNEIINLHTDRVNLGVQIRIPTVIWAVLYFITILAFGCVGYQIGISQIQYRTVVFMLILTFTSAITLIVDIDRPQEGLIQVSQQSLIDLMEKFNVSQKHFPSF